MHCSQFKIHYSEYRDGMIRNELFRRQMKAHLESCASCAAFNDSLNKGVSLIYDSGEILVPPGFKDRIVRTVKEKESETFAQPITPAPAGLAAAAMVAAAIALVVFEYQPQSPTEMAQISQPAEEILHTQMVSPVQIPQVSFTEHELPAIVELQPIPETGRSDAGDDGENDQP